MLKSSTRRPRGVFALSLVVGVLLGMLPVSARAQLSGTYSIGSGGSYVTFGAAVSALTTAGVSGPVTFNVLAGTYPEMFTIPAITGASATNVITFDGGTGNAATRIIQYDVTAQYGAVVTLDGADYITFKNLTIRSVNTSYGAGFLFTNSADYNEIRNCRIELPVTTTNTSHAGIRASSTSSTGTSGDHGNFNLIQDNVFIGGYYGVQWYGSGSTDYTTAQGNQFIGNTLTEWYYYGIRLYYAGGHPIVRGNTAIQRSSGGTGYAYYLYYPNDGPEFSYNYGHAHNYPMYVAYINNAQASTTNRGKVFNNMGIADGDGTQYGLYINDATYADVVYNSVRLIQTATGTGYGIYETGDASCADVKVLNNMISYEGNGSFYWIYNSTSGTASNFSAFDYNVFYKTGSGTDYCYWNGTNYGTFPALKAAVSGFHQNSTIADPQWFSATDLHSTSMAAYHAGTPFTGMLDDFDGNTRSLTTPCIGADEFAISTMMYASSTCTQTNLAVVPAGFANQELLGIQVEVTGSTSPISLTSFTLTTSGSTNSSDIAAAKVYYTGRSADFATSTLVGSASNPSGTYTITGNQPLEGPGTNYFWLVYDIAPSAPTGNYVDGGCTSITVGGTPYAPTVTNPAGNRMIIAPMNGVYTINPSGSGSRNYTSFDAAIDDLLLYGAGGPITFDVAAATYNEQLYIPAIPGASATNTITFDGGTGNAATRIITYSVPTSNASVITLDGADYVRFRNLTVNSTHADYGYGFLLTNSTNSDPSNYNEISNCFINLPANTNSSSHIGIVASSTSSYSDYGDWASHCLIADNVINSGYYGVRWNGLNVAADLTTSVGNQFLNNTIQDYYYYGLYVYHSVGVRIVGNTVLQRYTGTTTSSGYGIYAYYAKLGPEITNNYIHSHSYTLAVNYANGNYTSAGELGAARGKVFNNMIFAEALTSGTVYAFDAQDTRYMDIAFNTVHAKSTTGTCYGFRTNGSTTNFEIKVADNYIVQSGTGTFYPVYNPDLGDKTLYDNNAYWRTGTGTTTFNWGGTTYATLAALQAAVSGFHQNSVWGDPYFVSDSDLHSRSHVGYQAGIPFAGVVDDYDSDIRSPLTPCIGADEYPTPPPENDLAIAAARLGYAESHWARIEGAAQHQVSVVVENPGLGPNPPTVDLTYKVGSAPANSMDGVSQTFSPIWDANDRAELTFSQPVTGLAPGTDATIYVRAFQTGDQEALNDLASDTRWIDNVKTHGHEDFDRMAAPEFSDVPGYLAYPWTLLDVNGGTTWEVAAGVGIGGSNAVQYTGDGQPANDWIFTPAAELVAGASYRIGFQLRSVSGLPQTIEVAYGQTPDPSSMTTFATFKDFSNSAFLSAKVMAGGKDPYFNTPNISGPYYLGFRVSSDANAGAVLIDAIVLDDNPSPPPKIGYGLPGADISTFIDDPAVPIIVNSTYKSPGVINKTYSVASTTKIYGVSGDFLWDVETSTPWIRLTKSTPDATLQGYNLTPPRPRQFQTFTMTVNPSGLASGVHHGTITFYGILFNDDFPPPSNGLVATNEPMVVPVELRISATGTKPGPQSMQATIAGPLTVPGSPYFFTDVQSGDPIATLNVTSGQIDAMTITVFPNQLPTNITRLLYVKRYWRIAHTGTGWTADITFPYTDQEAAMVLDRTQLRGVRQAMPLSRWEDPIVGTASTSYPLTNEVMVHDFNPANIGGNIALAHPYFISKNEGTFTPVSFSLAQNHPNPFNPSTALSFAVAEERHVRIAVYSSLGVEVAELVNETLPAGRYEVAFDASDLPSGTYMYTMISGDFVQSRRMTLTK
jgi:hypothetical protein